VYNFFISNPKSIIFQPTLILRVSIKTYQANCSQKKKKIFITLRLRQDLLDSLDITGYLLEKKTFITFLFLIQNE
jgi:hypothetical protein